MIGIQVAHGQKNLGSVPGFLEVVFGGAKITAFGVEESADLNFAGVGDECEGLATHAALGHALHAWMLRSAGDAGNMGWMTRVCVCFDMMRMIDGWSSQTGHGLVN